MFLAQRHTKSAHNQLQEGYKILLEVAFPEKNLQKLVPFAEEEHS